MGVFDGQRAVWGWQYNAQAEQDPIAVANTLQQYAAASVWLVKVMDGTNWQARYDTGHSAIRSLGTWLATRDQAEQAGITAVPWVVPHGPEDAAAHGQLGPVLVVDLEPYPQFWEAAASEVPAYLAALRAGGVRQLYGSVDPRPQALADLDVARWAGSVDGLLPQLYWTDFQQPAMACLPYARACLALNPNIYPVLPYNGRAGDLLAFWNACLALGCRGVSLWRLGSASADQLRAFRALPLPGADPCAQLHADLAAVTADRDRLKAVLAEVRAAVDDFT